MAVLRFLLRSCQQRRDVAGSTALHDAAWGGHLKVAEAWANGRGGAWWWHYLGDTITRELARYKYPLGRELADRACSEDFCLLKTLV